MSNNTTLNDQILSLLECPTCLESFTPPIRMCAQGHSICNRCSGLVRRCPFCDTIVMKWSRNYMLESIVPMLKYVCENSNWGCNERGSIANIHNHQITCRKYNCTLDKNCSWRGRRWDLFAHATAAHIESTRVGPEYFDCIKCSEPPANALTVVSAHNEVFHVRLLQTRKGNSKMLHWITDYLGRPEDTINFMYEITITTEQFEHRKFHCTEIVHGEDMSIEEIIETGFSVSILLDKLKTFEHEKHVWYKVAIIKV